MSLKKFFIVLFSISLLVAIFIHFYPQIHSLISEEKTSKQSQIHQKSNGHSINIEPEFSNNDDFILIASLITSMLSFLGFILSSYYSIKGDTRDEELFDLKREKENLEMEKIRAEIQALRQKNNV
ncbi:MAG: hypothetical protein KAG56_09435 [Sulfurovaceae bacterium]|nr:hypothetical protein [Sulfurovaceae bacterium]